MVYKAILKKRQGVEVFNSRDDLMPQETEVVAVKELQGAVVLFYNTRQRRNIHPNKTNLVLGGRTFKNSGRLAFNSLPSEIKEASSLAIFKRLLKGHFI